MPAGEKQEEEYIQLTRVYAELVSPYFITNVNTNLEDWIKHYELYKKYCDRIDEEGEDVVIRQLEEQLFNYTAEESNSFCMRWGLKVYKYDKKHFINESESGLFEGRQFPLGYNPEGVFRVAYGDNWMYVPKPENQIVHDGIKYDDISFHEFTDRYLHKINRESVFEKFKRNKRSVASIYEKKIRVRSLVAQEKVIVGTKHVKKQLEGKEDYLKSLLEEKKYDEIFDEFSYYIGLQMTQEVVKYGHIVPISDGNLQTLLLAFIETGEYFRASRFLGFRKATGPLTDELKEIEAEIDFARQLSIARYDEKSQSKVTSLIEEYDSIYPNLLDIYRAKTWIMDSNAQSDDDFKEIDELCDEALMQYPFDGEIMAMQARAKSELGQKQESDRLYRKAIENTRNGLIWQKVEDEAGISRIEIERDLIEEDLA
jgi:hypothetical protein